MSSFTPRVAQRNGRRARSALLCNWYVRLLEALTTDLDDVGKTEKVTVRRTRRRSCSLRQETELRVVSLFATCSSCVSISHLSSST